LNTTRMKTECSEIFVSASLVQLTCEQNTGCLGLTVHNPFVVAFTSIEEWIVKADVRENMTDTWYVGNMRGILMWEVKARSSWWTQKVPDSLYEAEPRSRPLWCSREM
jgi:hypothetical protein